MNSIEIQKVIKETFVEPKFGLSAETLMARGVWEIALQMAVANERADAQPKTFNLSWPNPPAAWPTTYPLNTPLVPVYTPPTITCDVPFKGGPFGISAVHPPTTVTSPSACQFGDLHAELTPTGSIAGHEFVEVPDTRD